MAVAKSSTKIFSKVSEWIDAGHMETGFYLYESPQKQSAKAVAFKAMRYNRAGYPYSTLMWLPRSQIQAVENDFYTDCEKTVYLAPGWLIRKKRQEGFDPQAEEAA